MADKQLPPLYVRIVGDDSAFQKKLNDIVNDVAKLAQRLNESIDNAVKASNANIASAQAEKQRRLEDSHKKRMAALDVKHLDEKAIRDARLQQAQNISAIKTAAAQAKADDDHARRQAKANNDQSLAAIRVAAAQSKADDDHANRQAKANNAQLLQQQKVATEQARTDSIHAKTQASINEAAKMAALNRAKIQSKIDNEQLLQQQRIATEQAKTNAVNAKTQASINQAAKTAAMTRARIQNKINLDMTESAARAADIKLKSLAKVRQINQKTIDEHKKALADIDAKNKESAAKTAAITAKGAATAAGITLKANAVATASATRAAASAAATASKAAAQVAATQAKSAATTAKINAQTNYVNLQAQMAQTIGQQKLNSMQQQAQQSASKHSQNMLKTQQQILLNARKAARDEQTHVLEMRRMRWKMAREEEAHRQKMRIQEEIHQKRMNSKYYTTHPVRAASSVASSGRMRGGDSAGLGQGLSSRADIYMHANAIRALTQSGKGLIDLRADLLYAEVGIRAFTGDAQKAASVMQDIKNHAELTSFTRMGLTEATRNMMAYGLSADAALANIKMLGDVAGGNELRFERLSYAMSQITSMTRLQGQELKQLTEQGFNPLETISRKTGISMLDLKKMMEDGAISAEHVTEALKIETSAGGRFANQQKEMAKSLGGVRSQLIELVKNIKTDLIKLIEHELIKAMKIAIHYLKQFETYMNTKHGAAYVTRLLRMAMNAFVVVVAFHALGLAMATLTWWMQSVASIATRLSFVFTGIVKIAALIASAISSPFVIAVAAIGAAIWAILAFRGAVAGPDSAYSAILELWQGVQWVFSGIYGFFYNFSFNWMVLTGFFRAQWRKVLSDLLEATARIIPAMLENFVTLIRMLGRMFVVFFTWIVSSYRGLFGGQVYEAMVNGFMKIFTWLESKWKDFGTFIGKIWENLFDPAALYDVIMQGMGLDKVAEDMTNDITTTMEQGLFAGLQGVVTDELSNLRTGLEDMQPTADYGLVQQMLKLEAPALKLPKIPELPDAAAYTGKGFGDLTSGAGLLKNAKVEDAMAFGSSEYAKKLAETAMRFDFSGKPKTNPQLAEQKETNTLLGRILTALKGQNTVNLQGAGIGGGTNP